MLLKSSSSRWWSRLLCGCEGGGAAYLCVEKVVDDLVAQLGRDLHVLHGGVGGVDLLLEAASFLVELLDDDGHVAEDVRVDDRADDEHDRNEHEALRVARAHLVACQHLHRVVEAAPVLEHRLLLEDVRLDKHVIQRRHPVPLLAHQVEPAAPDHVQVHHQEKHQLQ